MVITLSKQNGCFPTLQRHALVVGAVDYLGQKLDNAVDDAVRIAKVLVARGFTVTSVHNPTKAEIDAALAEFSLRAQKSEIALVFLAGHAVERHGSGYFLPVDFQFPLTPGSLPYTALSLNSIIEATESAESRVIVLDACRNWPQDQDEERRVLNNLDQLIAGERDWPDLLLAYATSAKTTAGDGVSGAGSTFTNSLCKHLLDHSLTADECFRRVSQDVLSQRGKQQPWTYSSLTRTLSFTDLPRFSILQRYTIPNPKSFYGAGWSQVAADPRTVIVGLGDNLVWRVGISGLEKIHFLGEDLLTGAANFGEVLLIAGSEGTLYRAGSNTAPELDLEMKRSHGLKALPAGNGAVFYGTSVYCLAFISNAMEITAQFDLGFEVYSCIYMPDGMVWVAGERGKICEIDPSNPEATVRDVVQLNCPVNAMAVTSNGEQVFIVGQSGLAVVIHRSGQKVTDLFPDRKFKTAAGIRAQLLNLADDETIQKFIFDPKKLNQPIRDELDDHVGSPSFLTCALAPTLPILAVATQESSIVLVDTRDLQVIQELDIGSGNSSTVAAVHFLSDKELVVISGRGDVAFFGA